MSSQRFRRMIAMILIAAVSMSYLWVKVVQPQLQVHLDKEWAYEEGFMSQSNGTYGIAQGGDTDMVRTKDLDKSLLPGGYADERGKRRLVFVGDVHGCKDELVALLAAVSFDEELDHLILVGDVVSKGPDNIGVLDELIRLKATSVRGNHEDRLLHIAESLVEDAPPPTERSSSKGFAKDAALLKQMQPKHIEFLRSMPLILHIPALPKAFSSTTSNDSPITQHILVVHAGVVPGIRLQRQDPYLVMNMRSIDSRTHVPSATRSESRNSRPWFEVWGWYQERISKRSWIPGFDVAGKSDDYQITSDVGPDSSWLATSWKKIFDSQKWRPIPQVVVYGHDSKAGLQIKRFSKGLDTGCVGGGGLTAMILDAKGCTEIVQVGCKKSSR